MQLFPRPLVQLRNEKQMWGTHKRALVWSTLQSTEATGNRGLLLSLVFVRTTQATGEANVEGFRLSQKIHWSDEARSW